jgi:hypothetical protein
LLLGTGSVKSISKFDFSIEDLGEIGYEELLERFDSIDGLDIWFDFDDGLSHFVISEDH